MRKSNPLIKLRTSSIKTITPAASFVQVWVALTELPPAFPCGESFPERHDKASSPVKMAAHQVQHIWHCQIIRCYVHFRRISEPTRNSLPDDLVLFRNRRRYEISPESCHSLTKLSHLSALAHQLGRGYFRSRLKNVVQDILVIFCTSRNIILLKIMRPSSFGLAMESCPFSYYS